MCDRYQIASRNLFIRQEENINKSAFSPDIEKIYLRIVLKSKYNFASFITDFFEIIDGCGAFRNDCKRAGYTQVMVRVFVPIVTLRSAGCHVDNSPYLA